jgi:hypothetical protein
MVFLLLYLLQFSATAWMCEAVFYCLISPWHCSVWGTIFCYLTGMMNKFMFCLASLDTTAAMGGPANNFSIYIV